MNLKEHVSKLSAQRGMEAFMPQFLLPLMKGRLKDSQFDGIAEITGSRDSYTELGIKHCWQNGWIMKRSNLGIIC